MSISTASATEQMPAELSPHRIRRRLLQFAVVLVAVFLVVLVGPGLGGLRDRLSHASPGWVGVGVGCEVLSALSYVVMFRAVFCRLMTWRLSYQIAMAEQAANSVLSVSGAGGLALGVWALRRGGMSTEHIARRTVAFFFLTSLANVGGVIVFALLYRVGAIQHDPNPILTYIFGGAALAATTLVLSLPALLARGAPDWRPAKGSGKLHAALHFIRYSLGQGVRDAVALLRQRSIGVIGGSVGFMAFDIAVLGFSFKALGYSPPLGVLVLGYLIGQLGGNIPIPGGIGGVDGGLIGTFALYHQPIAVTTGAVLVYHAIAIWVPALLGSAAFVQLRHTLEREAQPAAMCAPMAEPIEVAHTPALAG
jgi:uncharacterized membrane protein YbhN (UPF0104 family)